MEGSIFRFLALHLLQLASPPLAKRVEERFPPELKGIEGWNFARREMDIGEGYRSKIQQILPDSPEPMIEKVFALGHKMCPFDAPDYPPLLREIPVPPYLLFYQGRLPDRPLIAMVGSRRATPRGAAFARDVAGALSSRGVGVVSGLAMGIDAAVAQGSIGARSPGFAVVGASLEFDYPTATARERRGLLEAGGSLWSEYPPGTAPHPRHFPRRNRIIAGVAWGTVVVEAAVKSGAMNTANHALEQNRVVFAVPQFPGTPNSAGCNLLLREGAVVLESVEDIEASAPVNFSKRLESPKKAIIEYDHPVKNRLYQALTKSPEGNTPDELAHATGIGISEVTSILTEWEMERIVASHEDGSFFLPVQQVWPRGKPR